VCDRECDFYDFFKTAEKYGSAVLVRASQNRTVNRTSRYVEKDVIKLWDYIKSQPTSGAYTIDISARQKTRHCKGRLKLNPPETIQNTNKRLYQIFTCMPSMHWK